MGNTVTECKHKCISSYNSTLNLKFESLKVNSWCDHIYFSTQCELSVSCFLEVVCRNSSPDFLNDIPEIFLDVSCLVLHSLTRRIMLRSRLWGDSPQRPVVCFSIRAFTALPVCLRSLSYWKIKLFPVRLFGLFYIHTSISSVGKTPNTTDQNEVPACVTDSFVVPLSISNLDSSHYKICFQFNSCVICYTSAFSLVFFKWQIHPVLFFSICTDLK